MSTPKKNVAYVTYIGLVDAATGEFRVNPTLAAGDVKIKTGTGGISDNLATLPVVEPAGSRIVKVSISASEMNADNNKVVVQFVDAAGSQWSELILSLDAPDVNVEDIVTAAQVWAFAARTLTQTASQIAAVLAGTTLTIHRGDSLSVAFTGLGSVTSRSLLHFTIKVKRGDPTDANAVIQVQHTVGTGTIDTDGLAILNGSTSVTESDALITIDNEAAGDITVTVEPNATKQLPLGSGFSYDLQMIATDGTVTTLTSGDCKINEDVSRVVS